MTIPASIATLLQPWASLYGNSQPVSLGITFLHLAGVMVGGGRAIAADAEVIASARPDRALVSRLGQAHRVVVPALVLTAITGALMAAGDVETFAESTAFGVKLIAVGLLALNGLLLWSSERQLRDGRGWGRARAAAGLSIWMWLVTLLAGCWLQVAG